MIRRTTLAAESDDLAVLEDEARRRGVSLAAVLREIVADAAQARRAARPRPRWPLYSGSGEAVAELSVADEEGPAAGRLRS
jgi:hypothetical protein